MSCKTLASDLGNFPFRMFDFAGKKTLNGRKEFEATQDASKKLFALLGCSQLFGFYRIVSFFSCT